MRILNEIESEIVRKKEERNNLDLGFIEVEYQFLIPRTTLCILGTEYGIFYGVAIRSKLDYDDVQIGKNIAFSRALEKFILS